MVSSHDDLAHAYIGNLKELIADGSFAPAVLDPLSPASHFGLRPRGSRELLGHMFRLANPTPGILKGKEITTDLQFLFGQFVWFIAGSDDLAWLSYYAGHAKLFSHDGKTLCGSFGKRIFGSGPASDQVRALVSLLRRDPGTRRGLISIVTPSDFLSQTKEFPCCSSLHFFVRNQLLHLVCTMRAQQALTILPYDVFLFVSILNILASELNLGIGTYTHVSGTLHFYEEELDAAISISNSEIEYVTLPPWKLGLDGVGLVVQWEARIRELANSGNRTDFSLLIETTQIDVSSMEGAVMAFCTLIAAERLGIEDEKCRAIERLRAFSF